MHFNKEHHPFIYLIVMGDGEHDARAAPIFGRRFVHCKEKTYFPEIPEEAENTASKF